MLSWGKSHPAKERVLQKLFSAFPSGWPGLGLFLLRWFVSATLISLTVPYIIQANAGPLGWIVIGLCLASAACLLAGFMTPLIATVVAAGSTIVAVSGVVPPPVEIIILAVIIALLGPGAFSLDARMFGRREILVSNTSRSAKS